MTSCPICLNPSRPLIEKAMEQEGAYRNVVTSYGWEAMRDVINGHLRETRSNGFDPEFVTAVGLEAHVSCPRLSPPTTTITAATTALTQGARKTAVAIADLSDDVFFIGERGEPVPASIPTPELLAAHILAAGLLNIRNHPQTIKPGHVISVLKLMGNLRQLDELVDIVKELIRAPGKAIPGAYTPPDLAEDTLTDNTLTDNVG